MQVTTPDNILPAGQDGISSATPGSTSGATSGTASGFAPGASPDFTPGAAPGILQKSAWGAMPLIAVIDYSKGNLRSVQKGLQLAGAKAFISADPEQMAKAHALVLPGVGSFASASQAMLSSGQMQMIRERVRAGLPFLGICLGLQLIFEHGDEGVAQPAWEHRWAEGLGLLPGRCVRVAASDAQGTLHKVPHVGWNQAWYTTANQAARATLFAGVPDGSNFYFTHSYQAEPACSGDIIAQVTHARTFTCAIARDNILATQFHPEKSSQKGLAVLQNFVNFVRERV